MILNREQAVLVFLDVQGKLADSMNGRDFLFNNLKKILQCAMLLEIPVIWMEQLPEKIGPTVEDFSALMKDLRPVKKDCFSCTNNKEFIEILKRSERSQILIAGIEAHICVLQTAVNLRQQGYEVFVLADAVSSRTKLNRKIALKRLEEEGVFLSTVEMAVFEMLKDAAQPVFKQVLEVIK